MLILRYFISLSITIFPWSFPQTAIRSVSEGLVHTQLYLVQRELVLHLKLDKSFVPDTPCHGLF